MPKIHMPEVKSIGANLGPLVGKTVRVRELEVANAFGDDVHTARYVTRDDQLAALLQVELPLAAYLGAALALIPAAGAQEAADSGRLDDNLTDAFSEVANILAALLCADGAPHVRWVDLETDPSRLGEADKAVLENPCERVDVEIEIEGYGGGKLSLVTARLD